MNIFDISAALMLLLSDTGFQTYLSHCPWIYYEPLTSVDISTIGQSLPDAIISR